MQIETKEIEHCKFEVSYKADIDTVKDKEKEAINSLRKLRVPGFRPGKAPDYAIRSKCKAQIKNWVAREMCNQSYDDFVFEKKAKTIGQPQFLSANLDGNNFDCKMVIHTKPNFTLGQYKGLEIPKPHMDRDVEAGIEKTIQDLRMRFADVRPYQEGDFIDTGDQITADFSTTDKDNNVEIKEGELYTIGENPMDDNLLGMAAGESREFDFQDKKIKVTVHMGMKRIPCPMDDELAKKVGLQNFAEVREKIGVIVGEQIKNKDNNMVKNQVVLRVIESTEVKVPQWLTDMEVQHILLQNNISAGVSSLSEEERNVFSEKAVKQIKLSLILDSVREAEPEATLSDAEAINALKQQVSMQGQEPEAFIAESSKNGRLFGMLAQLRDEFALQWLVNNSKIVE